MANRGVKLEMCSACPKNVGQKNGFRMLPEQSGNILCSGMSVWGEGGVFSLLVRAVGPSLLPTARGTVLCNSKLWQHS